MLEKGDRVVVLEGHYKYPGREGTVKRIPVSMSDYIYVTLDKTGREKTIKEPLIEVKFIQLMAKSQQKTGTPKPGKVLFGKDVLVIVTNPESPYHNMVGVTKDFFPDKEGSYPILFKDPTGLQKVKTEDLESWEESELAKTALPAQRTGATDGTLQDILISLITPDQLQPRQHFDEVALRELADSIQVHGVLQPIVVRPNPYLLNKEDKPYCIVFGERRWQAAQLVGFTVIPALLREKMTDMEALELQVIENLQRKDVHPMEEGRAFRRLKDGGSDIEALTHKIGMSAKYVATRIKLTDMTQQWQEAFLKDRIDFGQAIRLSKIDEKAQNMLYRDSRKDEGKIYLYNLDEIVRNQNHDLDKAPFKTEDPKLNPEMGACSTCPYNTSNTPRLFLGEERICTNSACYSIKEKNNYKLKLKKAASDPDVIFLDNAYYKDTEDKKKLQAALEMGVTVISREDVIEAPEDPGPKPEWELFLAAKKKEWEEIRDEGDEDLEEEEVKDEFNDELEAWEENKKDFESSLNPENIKRAFVVCGTNKGKYINVLIRAENPDVHDGDGKSEIGEIEKREARAKEIDNEKVYKQVVPLIKDHEEYLESTLPLSKEESAALTVLLIDAASYNERDWLKKALGIDDGYTLSTTTYNKVLSEMLPGTLNQFMRRIILGRLINATEIDYGRHGKAAAIMGIARQYRNAEVKEIELQQQEKAIKRSKRVADRIAALKKEAEKPEEPTQEQQADTLPPVAGEPIKIRAEIGRNIIKGFGITSAQAWSKLEGKFETAEAMNARYTELLSTGQYVEG